VLSSAAQLMMENIHSETYSLLLDTYIKDPVEKDSMFNAIENFPCIRKKAEWAQKVSTRTLTSHRRLELNLF